MVTFLVGLFYWFMIGLVLNIVHYHIYFRSIENTLDNYRGIDKEASALVDELRNTSNPVTIAITLYIIGGLFGPLKVLIIARDVYLFSIKGK